MEKIEELLMILRDKMELFDLFHQNDEVGMALKNLETEVKKQKDEK